ncbi:hypothetical protein [Thalassobacillus pellis]|uniref:hypothetical protein n=1 Tax=Thalassobacillus pellis TaxID=748008 RepID=UPI00196171C2|nr:hypothetical protein [Thalassobacillus pellis]MBM7553668.1 hypothetical protein [Thalassobacillus pellis]
MAEQPKNNEHKPVNRQKKDQPNNLPGNDPNILDKFQDEQHTDQIPVDDLNKEMKEEKKGRKTKNDSGSEGKYKQDYK